MTEFGIWDSEEQASQPRADPAFAESLIPNFESRFLRSKK